MNEYLPKSDQEAKKLSEAYRAGTVITHNNRQVRVVGMTRGIPARYLIEAAGAPTAGG